MSVDWHGYDVFDPWVAGPPEILSRAEALEMFERCMANRERRTEALRRLAAAHGVRVDEDDDSVQALNDWVTAEVAPDLEVPPGQMLPKWYSLAYDVGTFLGDVMIRRRPNLRWELGPSDTRNAECHRLLVKGFASEGSRSGGLDPVGVVTAYGLGLLHSRGFGSSYGVVTVKGHDLDLDDLAAHRPVPEPDTFLRLLQVAERRNDGPPFEETEEFRSIMGWWAPVERWLWRRARRRR